MTAGGRDGGEIEALITDRYLESLLTLGLGGTTRASLGETIAGRLQPQVRSRRTGSHATRPATTRRSGSRSGWH